MKQVVDITVRLGPEMPLYPGDPAPMVERLTSIASGDPLTASLLHLPAHPGTHVDLPAHFIEGGRVLGDYTVDNFCGPGWVLDLGDVLSVITRERLQTEEIPSDRHVLIKTRNSTLLRKPDFHHDYVYLDPPAVEYLLRRNPRSIGFDYYSLDPSSSETFPAHRLCAEAGLPVFVCLDLTRVEAGPWWFCGLPPAIPDVEGAPVRAIVWRDT